MPSITKEEFEAYEGVRKYGAWNMLSPQARQATELGKDKYFTIIKNYNELYDRFVKGKETAEWDSTYTD